MVVALLKIQKVVSNVAVCVIEKDTLRPVVPRQALFYSIILYIKFNNNQKT